MPIQIIALDKSCKRDKFDCGVPVLNDFIKTKARQNQEKGINRTYVAVEGEDEDKHVRGYYSVSAGEVNLDMLPETQRKTLPRHPVPIARIGRLAVDNASRGTGLGGMLLVDALTRIKKISREMGIFAIVVDAKDESAKRFYLKYGFIPFEVESNSLFLAIKSLP